MKTQQMNVRNYWNLWSEWIRKICFGKMDKTEDSSIVPK